MNCQPNDIVRVAHPDSQSYGAITRVLKAHPAGYGNWREEFGPVWEVETPLKAVVRDIAFLTKSYPDMALRPIRDPGEDAQDETLAWKPLPLPEIVPEMLDREVEHG